MDFDDFAKRHNVTVTATPIGHRSNGTGFDEEWSRTAVHWHIEMEIDGKPLWAGEFSHGIGHAESWARANARKAYVAGYKPPPARRQWLPDSKPMQALRQAYLATLHGDAMGCDQPFEDWAPELGLDTDSRRALAIWEACNDTRRRLQRAMTPEQWQEFTECTED